MTSLLGKLVRLFSHHRRIEDLFTEAIARLFERQPELCLSWLDELELITPISGEDQRYIHVITQKPFVALEEHGSGSRPDLIVEVHHAVEDNELNNLAEVVMIESKIGSIEGGDQLPRYAAHLSAMSASRKTLIYITRAYDPKDPDDIEAAAKDIKFRQLRWHDFYKFLQNTEKDALVEEVMLFMEEQGMARSYRFSTADLMALSGVPRAFEIFDETLGGEVRTKLESFAGNRPRREAVGLDGVRRFGTYQLVAPLHDWDLFCRLGYLLHMPDGYPAAVVKLQTKPRAIGREASIAAMKRIILLDGWNGYVLDDSSEWSLVEREKGLAHVLSETDHIAAVKHFFIESIHQLRDELTAFKKEHPDLPWNGGNNG